MRSKVVVGNWKLTEASPATNRCSGRSCGKSPERVGGVRRLRAYRIWPRSRGCSRLADRLGQPDCSRHDQAHTPGRFPGR